jgi:abortive infection bacteriophage resistance protein
MPFFMTRIPYNKPPLSYPKQLQRLKERGLVIADEKKALSLLENISYYRLSGYWLTMVSKSDRNAFTPDATFEKAFKLYCFDKDLRNLVISELEKIEVAVRAKMIYELSHSINDAFWFTKGDYFDDTVKHANDIVSIYKNVEQSKAEFITSFKKNYSDKLPPSWMMMEIITFGTLSRLYKNLKSETKTKRRDIANHFGLSDTVFESWLHCMVYVRNICAHHSRLWDLTLRINPTMPKTPTKQWLNNVHRIGNTINTYIVLSMVRYLLQTVNPNTSFKSKVDLLLKDYPEADTATMGFPENWRDEPLWT